MYRIKFFNANKEKYKEERLTLMEIKEFIEKSLKEIITATKDASNRDYKFVLANRDGKGVFFDIAVTVTETTDTGKEARGGIKVAGIFEAGGKIGKNVDLTQENTSRIKFNIGYRDLKEEKENFDIASNITDQNDDMGLTD